jgi:Mce-associated membrane protein
VTQVVRTTAGKRATEGAETEPVTDETPAEETPAQETVADTEASGERETPAEETVADAEISDEGETPAEEDTDAAEPAPSKKAEEEKKEEEAAPGGRRRRLPRISDPVLLAATVLVVAAGACAAYFGWSWYRAAHDDALAYSRARDAVLYAAEQGVQNMNTLDYRKVDQGLAAWEDSSTGDLHQELVQGRAQFMAQVQVAKTVTTAKILDGAVTELDDRTGKAGVIVAVQITVTPPSGPPTTKQSRMRAQLTRTPSGWKLSALGQAPVGTTAGG